ncbi:MAG: flagellar biosynthetic protein FliO [Desulfovibrio sp.]|nr:flagellar biosynthetic protein FliO [Desulfovibrio sp.]
MQKAVDAASDTAFQAAADVGPNIAAPASQNLGASTFSWGGYIQALAILCLLLGGLWFLVWAVRKYGKFNFLPRPGSLPKDSLLMEAQMPLGPKKGLMVVRFMNKRLLLGVTENQISMLAEEDCGVAARERDFKTYMEDARSSCSEKSGDPSS